MRRDLPTIDEAFFQEFARGEPEEALRAWEEWMNSRRRRPDSESAYREAMKICSGLGEASVRHYLKGRHHFLSTENLDRLDRLAKGLGQDPVPRAEVPAEAAARPRRSNRLALLTQLQVPSETYHMELIRGIVRDASLHHLAVAIHEVSPIDLRASIGKVRTNFRPDGIVMLRVTPAPRDLEGLTRSNIPVVLVHADRYRYPRPVLANIVPNQERLDADLKVWLDRYWLPVRQGRRVKRSTAGKAVLVRMPWETSSDEFPRIVTGVEPSIRNDRIARLERALRKEFRLKIEEVPDYRFRHSLQVFSNHPDADLYVSLSDQIAVGLKHMLIAAGRPWDHRIVGFDDSPTAKEECLASFSQSLEKIGFLVVDRMCRFFRLGGGCWPEFEELPIDVHLEVRCAIGRGEVKSRQLTSGRGDGCRRA